MIGKLARFIRRYEFPFHFLVGWTIVRTRLSTWAGTVRTKLLLGLMDCSYGKKLYVDGRIWIWAQRKGAIRIGDNVKINSRFGSNLVGITNPFIFQCIENGTISIGNDCGLSAAVLSSRTNIEIGDRTMVGGNVRIFDHDYHSLDYQLRCGKEDGLHVKSRPVTIGTDVFIGTNAIILKGVSIGDRSIVGAGSVVVCNVPSDEIWAGNPAQKIKSAKPSVQRSDFS